MWFAISQSEIVRPQSQLCLRHCLSLSSNRLNRTIPILVWRLRNREMLYLNDNSLFGQITGPVEVMNLARSILQTTKSEDRHQRIVVTFEVDPDLFVARQPYLRTHVWFPRVLHSSPCSLLWNFHAAFYLVDFPTSWGSIWCFLKIEISSNNLSGKLPEGLRSFQTLQYVDLSHNSLSGELPESILNSSSLRSIFWYNNQFTGGFPSKMVTVGVYYDYVKENGFSCLLSSKLGSNITINIRNNRF